MRLNLLQTLKERWPFLLIGLAVSGGLLQYGLRDLDMGQVGLALREADYRWLIPAVGVYFISVWFRAWRWGFLLRTGQLSTARLFPIVVIGYMGNNTLPFRLGEGLRAYLLWRKEKINIGTTLTTAILERLFDGLTLVTFVLFGLIFLPRPLFLGRTITVAGGVFFGALAVFLYLAAHPALLRRLAIPPIERLLPARFRPPVLRLLEGIIAGLERLRSGRDVLVIFGVTVIVWLVEMAKYWLVSLAFPDLHLSYVAIMLMGGTVNLLTALPSLPGYIGTFEVGIQILREIGAPAASAGSYVLVLHALLLLPVTLLGVLFLIFG